MKQSNKKILVLSLVLLGYIANIEAQVTTVGNGFPGAATDYAGWNATRPFPFTLAHKGNFPINFQTNGTQRMTIRNTSGFVGIGNSFNTPANRLHLFQPSGTFGLQITNNTTGNSAANGFSMNLIGAGPDNGEFQFTQHFNRNVAFIMPQTTNPLMELTWNLGPLPLGLGQIQMRPGTNPLVGGAPIYDAALLNIGGAIGFSPGSLNE